MNVTARTLFALAALVALADWIAVARHRKGIEYVCKPLVLVLLAGCALLLVPAAGEAQRRAFFTGGLALSLLGDVFLVLPRDAFLAGLASFLAAHVLYVTGFLSAGASLGRALAVSAVVLLALAPIAWRVLRALLASDRRRLVPPVVVYLLALALLLGAAVASGDRIAVVGAAIFLLSDALLAWNRFVRPRPILPLAVIVTYHVAQASLVLSLVW